MWTGIRSEGLRRREAEALTSFRMLHPKLGFLALLLALSAVTACSRGSGGGAYDLGPVTRLNDEEGMAGTFSWPYYTAITARGADVVASWLNRNGPRDRDLMVRASGDSADSWGPAQLMNDGEYQRTVSVVPKLAPLSAQSELLIVWHARRNVAGQKFVLARRSEDFGKSWAPVQRLNSVTQSFLASVGVHGDEVVVAYSDERNIERDIFANRSLDSGRTWMETDVRVDRGVKSNSDAPAVAIGADGRAYVAWEQRPGRNAEEKRTQIQVASSADHGQTWDQPHRVEPDDQPVSPMWPALVESKGRLVAAWTGGLSGDTSQSWLWLATSTDHGTTWSAPQLVYEGSVQTFFQLLSSGDRVFLVWHAGDSGKPSGVYFNASDDGGATWRQPWNAPLRVDDGKAPGDGARHPRMAIQGDSGVAITWQENEQKIQVRMSDDAGRTWPTPPIEVAAAAEKTTVRYPQVARSDRGAFVLWEAWTDMSGQRKNLGDLDKPTPRDVYVRGVKRR
jgi:Neuraminidase (sialidase)